MSTLLDKIVLTPTLTKYRFETVALWEEIFCQYQRYSELPVTGVLFEMPDEKVTYCIGGLLNSREKGSVLGSSSHKKN